jgi:tetrahydromethanopterin S-methyltransferase subunit G
VVEDKSVDGPLLRAFAPLHRSALGIACGVVVGGLLFMVTVISTLRGTFPAPNLYLLAQFFWGYSVSWPGAFIGLLWGAVVGFVLGYGFALVRNAAVWLWLTVIRSRAEMEQYSDFLDHL